MERIQCYGEVDKERILAGTIELYEYFFSALLGAGLSQKQNLIFRYLAHLMLNIRGANIHTLRELLETPERFQDDIAKLDGTARLFFERQFFDKSFDDTRMQVVRRLWGVISNPTFERIFSARTSKIDFFAAMNAGKIILINTAKDLLKQEGTAIFGRFFIAMIAQAAMERALIPRQERTPTFVYIDEAQDYFDDNIDHMLEQVRKYRIGLVLAHQTLAQLSPKLKASIMANTATKLVGGLSATDAHTIAKEMGCDPLFLQSMRKTSKATSFALWVRNLIRRPIELKVQLGVVDSQPRLPDAAYTQLVEQNRERYSVLPSDSTVEPEAVDVEVLEAAYARHAEQNRERDCLLPSDSPEKPEAVDVEVPEAVEEPPIDLAIENVVSEVEDPPPDHRTIQSEIRALAHEQSFHVTVEKPLPDGKRIDIVLERSDISIACEISCTTKPAHEVANLKKCLDAGFEAIWSIANSEEQRDAIERAARTGLTEKDLRSVSFLTVDQIEDHLPRMTMPATNTEVIGYHVATKLVPLNREQREFKRNQLKRLLEHESIPAL